MDQIILNKLFFRKRKTIRRRFMIKSIYRINVFNTTFTLLYCTPYFVKNGNFVRVNLEFRIYFNLEFQNPTSSNKGF